MVTELADEYKGLFTPKPKLFFFFFKSISVFIFKVSTEVIPITEERIPSSSVVLEWPTTRVNKTSSKHYPLS